MGLDHPKRRWPSKTQREAAKLNHRPRCSGNHTATGACIVGLGRKKLTRTQMSLWSDRQLVERCANATMAEKNGRPTGWSDVDRLLMSREVSFRGLAFEVLRRLMFVNK